MPLIGAHGAWQGQERLDDEAHGAVECAEAIAAGRGLGRAGPDALLRALLDERSGAVARLLRRAGGDPAVLRATVDGALGAARGGDTARVPLDADARECVILGTNEARRAGLERAGVGHLVLGIVAARVGIGARTLTQAGITVEVLRDVLTEMEARTKRPTLFQAQFDALLAHVGDASVCPRCGAPLHASFRYCYRCGGSCG